MKRRASTERELVQACRELLRALEAERPMLLVATPRGHVVLSSWDGARNAHGDELRAGSVVVRRSRGVENAIAELRALLP